MHCEECSKPQEESEYVAVEINSPAANQLRLDTPTGGNGGHHIVCETCYQVAIDVIDRRPDSLTDTLASN